MFRAWANQVVQGNWHEAKTPILEADMDTWKEIEGMSRADAAALWLPDACELVKRTSNDCDESRRNVNRDYDNCVSDMEDNFDMSQLEIDQAT